MILTDTLTFDLNDDNYTITDEQGRPLPPWSDDDVAAMVEADEEEAEQGE